MDRLFQDHADVVYRYAASRCGPDAAHDITAETFAQALRGGFDPARGTPRAWLLGIATNEISRHCRTEARHLRAVPRPVPEDALSGLAERVDAERLAPALRAALLELPEGERAALLLHAIADLSPTEVATALGIAPGAARTRLSRARARLASTLPQEASR